MTTSSNSETEHRVCGWPLPSGSEVGVACMGLRAVLQDGMGDWSGETEERCSLWCSGSPPGPITASGVHSVPTSPNTGHQMEGQEHHGPQAPTGASLPGVGEQRDSRGLVLAHASNLPSCLSLPADQSCGLQALLQ